MTANLEGSNERQRKAPQRDASSEGTPGCARAVLAAEYRALAENPPSARIATHYLYDTEGRSLVEYDEARPVEREYVYLDGLPLAQITGTTIALQGLENVQQLYEGIVVRIEHHR